MAVVPPIEIGLDKETKTLLQEFDPIPNLRDRFAAAALTGYLARVYQGPYDGDGCSTEDSSQAVSWAYDVAEEMLAERERREAARHEAETCTCGVVRAEHGALEHQFRANQ